MSRKKLVLVLIAAALAVSVGVVAWAQTWADRTLSCTCVVDCFADLEVYEECACLTIVTTLDFGDVHAGNLYEQAVYIRNIGTEKIWVTYDPHDFTEDPGGVFQFQPQVIAFGPVCEVLN